MLIKKEISLETLPDHLKSFSVIMLSSSGSQDSRSGGPGWPDPVVSESGTGAFPIYDSVQPHDQTGLYLYFIKISSSSPAFRMGNLCLWKLCHPCRFSLRISHGSESDRRSVPEGTDHA